jgi:hypothetical protein
MSTPSSSLKLRIDARGNVGVGTVNPSQRLHVSGGNIGLDSGSSLRINNVPVLTSTSLGNTVITSSLQTVGNLSTLRVTGDVNVDNGTFVVNSGSKGLLLDCVDL